MDCIIFHGDKGEASRRQVRSAAAQHSHRIGPRKPKSSKKPKSEESPAKKRTLKANLIVPYAPEHSCANRTAKKQCAAASSSSSSSSGGSSPQHAAAPTLSRASSSNTADLYRSSPPGEDHQQIAQLDAKLAVMDERLDRQKRTLEEDQARRQRKQRIPPLRWKQTIITGSPPSPVQPSLPGPAPPGPSNNVPMHNSRTDSTAVPQSEKLQTAPPQPPIIVKREPQITTTTSSASHSRQSSGARSLSPTSQLPLYSWTEYPRYSQSSQKYGDPRGVASSTAPIHPPASARARSTAQMALPAPVPAPAASPTLPPGQSSTPAVPAPVSSIAPALSAALFRSAPPSWRPVDSQGFPPRGGESESTRPQGIPKPEPMTWSRDVPGPESTGTWSRSGSREFLRPESSPRELSRPMSDDHQRGSFFQSTSAVLDDSRQRPRSDGREGADGLHGR